MNCDPTKAEMLAAIAEAFGPSCYPGVREYCENPEYDNSKGQLDGSDYLGAAFDVESAIWWFCCDWSVCGMPGVATTANLYAAQAASEFNPGCEGHPQEAEGERETEREIYEFLERHFMNHTEGHLE
jgi:hypothetical protein